jgi:hypothetical protein
MKESATHRLRAPASMPGRSCISQGWLMMMQFQEDDHGMQNRGSRMVFRLARIVIEVLAGGQDCNSCLYRPSIEITHPTEIAKNETQYHLRSRSPPSHPFISSRNNPLIPAKNCPISLVSFSLSSTFSTLPISLTSTAPPNPLTS